MLKLYTTAIAFTAMALCGYAQVGSSAIGAGVVLGVVNTGQGTALGKSIVATSVKCNAACTDIYPVTGLNLQGQRLNPSSVNLNWFTLMETNNKGFYVQRSLSSANAFKTVGFVPGAGTTSQKKTYTFLDTNNYPGISYYRLQQVDNDGAFVFSNTISIKGISTGSLIIMPNPARNTCTLQLPASFAGTKVQVVLYSVSGKVVFGKFYSAGTNPNIYITNLAQLKAGTYIVAANNGGALLFGKLSILE